MGDQDARGDADRVRRTPQSTARSDSSGIVPDCCDQADLCAPTFGGGGGNGWTLCTSESVPASSAEEPELPAMRADVTCPAGSSWTQDWIWRVLEVLGPLVGTACCAREYRWSGFSNWAVH